MKKWWLNLESREKTVLMVGSVCFTVLLLFGAVWLPLKDSLAYYQRAKINAESLLEWMIPRAQKIQQYRTLNHKQSAGLSVTTFLPTIESEIKKSNLSSALSQISMGMDQSVTLQFSTVSFDDFIRWLSELNHKYGVDADNLSVTRLDEPGMVQVTLQLVR